MTNMTITEHSELLQATEQRIQSVLVGFVDELEFVGDAASKQSQLETALKDQSTESLFDTNPDDAVERLIMRSADPLHSSLDVGRERLLDDNDLLAIRYLELGQRAARAVGRIVVRNSSGRILGHGTGVMISPRLLMTNNHVLNSPQRAAASLVEFNFQQGLDGAELPKVAFQLRPDVFFATDRATQLDLTVLAVSPASDGGNSELDRFGFSPLFDGQDDILAGQSVSIIQHPSGRHKHIALRDNQVLKFPDTAARYLYYRTDTMPGSSGSPVYNDHWEIVALHHSGFPKRNSRGQILARNGRIWQRHMGDDMIDWIANEGILIRAIREFLAGLASLTLHQQQLRDEVLTPSSSGFGPRQNERQLTTGPAGSTQQPTVDGNTALWTLPVTIAVSVGSPSGPPVATSTAPPDPPLLGGGPIDQPSVAPTVDDGDQDDEELLQSDVDQAVAEFQNAASRVYYDAQADDEDRRRYYSSISESLSPAQLYDALSRLSKAKHTTRLGYKPSRHLYPWVDLRPDLTIASVYSGQSFDPVELIEADYQTAEMRRERLAEFRLNESAGDPMTPADFYDSLESSLRFNCEHCVPQSWYSKRQPMRGDLHHLFACEPRCNSFRGNMPYFDFSDYREAIRSDCGKSESRKFEPNAGNGFVARATLYFIIRYPSVIKRTNAQYPTSRLEVLLDWHRQFPLTEYERHRNQAIFAMQGNRNPLIDYPDWADQIDFSQGIS